MKALVLNAYKELDYTDFPMPEIAADEVLIEVKACGICGSDVHGYDGSSGRRIPPLIMGHELSGVIIEVGSAVREWKPGERVTCDSTEYCGECHFCRRGAINLCDNRRVLGVSTDEYRRHGGFAEYLALPERILYRLPDAVSFSEGAMVEPLSIAMHAAAITPLQINDTVVVVGAGLIGLLLIQVLRTAGCGQIIALDIDQDRLDLACKLGADVGLRTDRPGYQEVILEHSLGRGADRAFEVVGITPTFNAAVDSVRKGGSVTLVGNISPQVELALQTIVTREITLYGSCASQGEYVACLDMIARGKVDVEALISAKAPLKAGGTWFKRLYEREAGLMKVLLEP